MTLDTVVIAVTPKDTLKILNRIDDRGESWGFNGFEETSAVRSVQSRTMLLNIEGVDEVLEVTLNADGTWSANTHISLGEAK